MKKSLQNLVTTGCDIFKECLKCNTWKPLNEFYFLKDKHEFIGYCCVCKKIIVDNHYINNKEKIKEKRNKYYISNKEKIKTNIKNYSIKNKEKRYEYLIKNKSKLKKQRKKYFKEYKKNNIKQIKENSRQYYQKNKEKIKTYNKKYTKIKLKTNNNFRFSVMTRQRIVDGFKSQNIKKYIKSDKLLCCTYNEGRKHIELQFKDAMTWENHNTLWHIDHIIPISFFDLSDPTEQKLAFHWGNLQPLLIKENLEKSNKILEKTNFKYFY